MSMKNPNDSIGNRTRDLPVCSAVSQPITSLRAQITRCIFRNVMQPVGISDSRQVTAYPVMKRASLRTLERTTKPWRSRAGTLTKDLTAKTSR